MHFFHIPTMGTCFTADSPIRVAPLGISSVISLVDDILLEQLRKYYAAEYQMSYEPIPLNAEDGRAKRITAYLNLVKIIVDRNFKEIRELPLGNDNRKDLYFRLLPEDHPLKKGYLDFLAAPENSQERKDLETGLSAGMKPGSIDVNIMVKLDRVPLDASGNKADDLYSDAKTALRGYALSDLDHSAIVFSAGINQNLYQYASQFPDFYRDENGVIKKRIIVKISDYRSALTQGKFFARKGLEISEFRIESALNCGGHTFPAKGLLLPQILAEVCENRESLLHSFKPAVRKYYESVIGDVSRLEKEYETRITVQGGIGTADEIARLKEDYQVDGVGIGSPFLLVPEATLLDHTTREALAKATSKELYLSYASPLGVPFNNLYTSGSERARRRALSEGRPGTACPKGFLRNNTEFTSYPVCTASAFYQKKKAEALQSAGLSPEELERQLAMVYEKSCICDQLGNGALIAFGIKAEANAPQAICPGPGAAYFNREYSLTEMADHFYGRGKSLVSEDRPHFFAEEIRIYTEWFGNAVARYEGDPDYGKWLDEAGANLQKAFEFCLKIADGKRFGNENLESIAEAVQTCKPLIESAVKALAAKRNNRNS